MAMAEQQNGPEALNSSSKEQEFSRKTGPNSAKGFASFAGPRKAAPRRPSPEEMIEYYSRKGLDKEAATEKVIDDLQKALTMAVRRAQDVEKAEKSVRSIHSTFDSLSTRLSAVEAKVDALPGTGAVFVAGVASGSFLRAVPHILKAVSEVGRGLKDAISSRP